MSSQDWPRPENARSLLFPRRTTLRSVILGLLLTGCAANQPYHLAEAPRETAVTPGVTHTAKDIYRLAFIEFDEEGGRTRDV